MSELNQLPDAPLKPKGNAWAIKKYYDDNRLQIEREINEHGEKKTLRRWGIASGTWTGIKRRWSGLSKSVVQRVAKTKTRLVQVNVKVLPIPYSSPVPLNDREMSLWLLGYQEGVNQVMRRQS